MKHVDSVNAKNALDEMFKIVILLQTESIRSFTPAERKMAIDALKGKIAIYEDAHQMPET